MSMSKIFVRAVAALEDNFMYILACKATGICALIDPVQPDRALAELHSIGQNWNLKWALTTHHHWDHAGGNNKLKELQPSIKIYGGDQRVEGVTDICKDGDVLELGSLKISCLATPCHTSGHICYHVTSDDGESVVFTGDTLFIAGCGKFFEGDGAQMHSALNGKLAKLPLDTKVYCGHEYTLSNLKFAQHVEPNNKEIAKKIAWAAETRSSGGFTVPSSIKAELEINPFMRVSIADVQQHVGCSDPIATMSKLREAKNNFRAK